MVREKVLTCLPMISQFRLSGDRSESLFPSSSDLAVFQDDMGTSRYL